MAPRPSTSPQFDEAGTAPEDKFYSNGFELVQQKTEAVVGVCELPGASASIRLMHDGDLPWLAYLCLKRYSHRYDQEGTEGWFRNIVLKSPLLFYPSRTDHAFTITMLSCVPWLPTEWAADVVFTCADDGAMWEVLSLLRKSIEWSRKRRASVWRIMSDTDYDIAPLARRVGAGEIMPRYVLRL